MVRFFERRHVYEANFDTVTAAWFVKYPNAETQHVKEIHTVERSIAADEKSFSARRLFYVEFGIPGWIQKLMNKRMEGYAVEEVTCSVFPKKKLTAVGRNVTFSSFFQMEETIQYEPDPDQPERRTLFTQKMQFRVFGLGPIGGKLETAARDSAETKSSQGLQLMERLIERLERQSEWRSRADKAEEKLMSKLSLHPSDIRDAREVDK